MLYTGVKGYIKKLMIYFKSWRILIPILITLYLLIVDQSTNYFTNYNVAYVLWILFYTQSASKKPKEWKMLSILPSDARLRTMHLVSEVIGMTVILILWRISIYIIELLLKLCTLQSAVHKFFGVDLILILLISTMSRITMTKAKINHIKNKTIYYTTFILGGILLCIHVVLFILNPEQVWLNITFTVLAYLSIAAIWYVLLLEMRDWTFDYEAMIAKPVRK